MPQPTPNPPPSWIRGLCQGLGNIVEFFKESALAVIEVAIGRWPQPFGELRRRPKAADKGLVQKVAPFPIDD